jgi:prepilin-type N-terminal cleavage/methylation domain-containing protein
MTSNLGDIMRSASGFTLIELLVVIAIITLLTYMGFALFALHKATAAYAAAAQTRRHAQTALEAGVNDFDHPPGAVGLVQQGTRGTLNDAAARALLPGFQVPDNVVFRVSYDPSCEDAGCEREFLQVNHCLGKEFVRWVRFGDGVDVLFEHVPGEGCS